LDRAGLERQGYSVAALWGMAKRRLPRVVFDFCDGGAEDEITRGRNEATFAGSEFLPTPLNDSGALFGEHLALPPIIGPSGLSGLGVAGRRRAPRQRRGQDDRARRHRLPDRPPSSLGPFGRGRGGRRAGSGGLPARPRSGPGPCRPGRHRAGRSRPARPGWCFERRARDRDRPAAGAPLTPHDGGVMTRRPAPARDLRTGRAAAAGRAS
jgi:FMN-dependent dehydrogenase